MGADASKRRGYIQMQPAATTSMRVVAAGALLLWQIVGFLPAPYICVCLLLL